MDLGLTQSGWNVSQGISGPCGLASATLAAGPAPKTPFALLLLGADPAKVSQLEGGRWLGLWGGWAWVPVPPLPPLGCVTGRSSLLLSEPPFPLPKQ